MINGKKILCRKRKEEWWCSADKRREWAWGSFVLFRTVDKVRTAGSGPTLKETKLFFTYRRFLKVKLRWWRQRPLSHSAHTWDPWICFRHYPLWIILDFSWRILFGFKKKKKNVIKKKLSLIRWGWRNQHIKLREFD